MEMYMELASKIMTHVRNLRLILNEFTWEDKKLKLDEIRAVWRELLPCIPLQARLQSLRGHGLNSKSRKLVLSWGPSDAAATGSPVDIANDTILGWFSWFLVGVRKEKDICSQTHKESHRETDRHAFSLYIDHQHHHQFHNFFLTLSHTCIPMTGIGILSTGFCLYSFMNVCMDMFMYFLQF